MNLKIYKDGAKFCLSKNLRFTDPRKYVLKIISSSKYPLKAYDILKKLKKFIKNPQPPTVYRAIEFWQKNRFIHRVESLNAYKACDSHHSHEGSQFLICKDCGDVVESNFSELSALIKSNLQKNSFRLDEWNLEINGVCCKCS